MTFDQDKEKATGALQAPEVAIQNQSNRSLVVQPGSSMLDAMRGAGLVPLKALDLQDDGKVHRFRVEGDKAGSSNGWYVLHSYPVQAGAFGSWKTGEQHTWREATSKPPSAAERAALQQRMQAMQQARAAEQEDAYCAARERAQAMISKSMAARDDHPYLLRKKALAHGVRQLGAALLIPVRNAQGELQTLQMIAPDGTKMFLSGGRVAGGFYLIGEVGEVLLIAEGFATASTLHTATQYAVAVAFNAGNLERVARSLRRLHKTTRIVVCADNDAQTPGNPGLTKATEAARAVRGFVAMPRFKGAANV